MSSSPVVNHGSAEDNVASIAGAVQAGQQPRSFWELLQFSALEPALALVSVALGIFHAWIARYALNPDGMSYLDVGRSFYQGDWAHAINAWWSPLYPWTLGALLGVAKPSPRWELPFAEIVNTGIFVLALLAFRTLLREFIILGRQSSPDRSISGSKPLPEWALTLLAYATFLWISLEVDPLWYVTPDLAVLACFCLIAAMLLSLRRTNRTWRFAIFGLILGMGYWTKSILLPIGFAALALGYWWRRQSPQWGRGMLAACLMFLCIAAPLTVLLSRQKGRFTFGDAGKLNYAWALSPQIGPRNWQGEIPGSGTPVHPTRQLLRQPPLFEFDGPVVGTYPPWTDPSYWNEGLQWHFNLKAQLRVLAVTVPSEARLLLRSRPELFTGVLILALLAGKLWPGGLRQLWPLVALSLIGMALYLPLVENDRYLGGFVLVFYLSLLAAVRLRPEAQKAAGYVAFAVFCSMMLATADYTVRVAAHHLAIPGSGPNSTLPDIAAAGKLWQMGVKPGDKVAVIMDGTGAYWAHLAKLRIVAEIMDTGHGSTEFWRSSVTTQQHVFDLFSQAHAKLVVAVCPAGMGPLTQWEAIPETAYCVHWLDGSAEVEHSRR